VHHVGARQIVLLFLCKKSNDLIACSSFIAKSSSILFARFLVIGLYFFGILDGRDLNMEKICMQIKDFQKVLPKLFGIRKSNGTILYFDFSQNILSEVRFDAGHTGAIH